MRLQNPINDASALVFPIIRYVSKKSFKLEFISVGVDNVNLFENL